MARFELRFKSSVSKDLRKIPAKDVKRILERINRLADDPRAPGCISLQGQKYYRVRIGHYRVVYEIRDAELVVLVITVAHRSRVYN